VSGNGRRRDSIFAGQPELPKRPFRNSALFYAALAAIGFAFLLATGQSADRAAVGAAFAFVVGTALTWLGLTRARREQQRRERKQAQ